ncbi:MAG: hypothetical protein QM651_13620 [Rhodoblastus sp.]
MIDMFRTFVEHCGFDTAEAFIRHFGGLRLYIPATWSADHELNAMGEAHARKIMEQFGGTRIEVPKHDGASRRRLVRALHRAGASRNAAAKAANYTERHVRRLVADDEDDAQGRLF